VKTIDAFRSRVWKPRPSLACVSLALVLLAVSCSGEPPTLSTVPADGEAGSQGNLAATQSTRRANQAVAQALPFEDRRDFETAERGLVAREPEVVVRDASGRVVWDTSAYAFEEGEAPESVNPSLWRQAQLNNLHGLYEVVEGVYQLRGYDLSNMSIIQGETGWIIVDPLTVEETAAAALAMARKHLGTAPIVAVIFTHSHLDHFGGVLGVISAEDVSSGRVRVIAPQHFIEESTSENILAGIAMGRRASFMYGFPLERSARGHVGSGLGKAPARGSFAILPPTDIVDHTGQELTIDGVRFVFQHAPGSEAPAELTFYLPDRKALCGAEVVSRNLHNVYTLRGAKVRDATRWSGYIDELIRIFPDAEVLFASHHWPTWGRPEIVDYLEKQRDTYKYIHDQTLRHANAGLTPREIAEVIQLPPELARSFPNRDYYGTVRHNSKAVYQRYFGWYDGNPAHLDPLPPEAEGERYVAFMGGADQLLAKAGASFEAGEYRFTATVLNHLVFAEPENGEARELLARTYEQLGYRAESGPWRDVYLTAALELRRGLTGSALDPSAAGAMLIHLPVRLFFDAMAVRLKGEAAAGEHVSVNFVFTDSGESRLVTVKNAVLNHRPSEPDEPADVTVELTRELWVKIVTQQAGLRDIIFSDDLQVSGSRVDLVAFFMLLDRPDGKFGIVTP
jgi:alkyl sulfatase BDS1-like metallo-beta-lactamase superfamily hydrolase